MDGLLESNFAKARELLKEAGYNGEPIVLMHSTDVASLTNLAPVAKDLMEAIGMNVDMQSMDCQAVSAGMPSSRHGPRVTSSTRSPWRS